MRRPTHLCRSADKAAVFVRFRFFPVKKRNSIMGALFAHTHMRASPCEQDIIKPGIFIIKDDHSPNRRCQQQLMG